MDNWLSVFLTGITGYINWAGNWITFFDSVTQLSIMEIANNMVLPRDFKCIMIDPAEHERKVQKYGTGRGLETFSFCTEKSTFEPPHGKIKTNNLPRRKQRRRSASG